MLMRASHVLPALRTAFISQRRFCRKTSPSINCRSTHLADETSELDTESIVEAQSLRSDGGRHASTSGREVEGSTKHSFQAWIPEAGLPPLEPGLYLVGTPIGNLEDVTFRALRVLQSADVILAEDTRHSRKLLNHYRIDTRLTSYHQHNERGKLEQVLQMLNGGRAIALISDAGMPLISDPGESLVKAVSARGVKVFPIPGPSAVLSALVASGLPTSSFLFCGFLPAKANGRAEAIKAVSGSPATLIFFVPPHSLARILADLAAHLGPSRQCVVAREITKRHEEFFRGSLQAAEAAFSTAPPKGEVTLAVAGCEEVAAASPPGEEIEGQLKELVEGGCSPSVAAKVLAKALGLPRNSVYSVAMRIKKDRPERVAT